jgi:uncharacterized protein (DUF427 family)
VGDGAESLSVALGEDERVMPASPPSNAALLRAVAASRAAWNHAERPATIEPAGPGEESVWSFPRPPRVESVAARVVVAAGTRVVAETRDALRVVETAGAPCYYLPAADCDASVLRSTGRWTVCEWKGVACGYDVLAGDRRYASAAWTYPDPLDDLGCGFARIAGRFAFYAHELICTIDGERVRPQPGGFYGGWVTARLRGPIKGVPGSGRW